MQLVKNGVSTTAFAVIGLASFALVWCWNGIAQAAEDYSALTTGFAAELTAALPVALAAVGLFVGVLMAYRVVRRILRA